jgi:signal transduction histidine kinase
MSVNQVLTFVAQVFFILLSLVAIIDYVFHRNPRRRDFALFTSALGLPLGITLLRDIFGYQTFALNLGGAFALFSQPYFLFRLLQYYRPKPKWLHVLILLGMVACWVILYRYIGTNPVTTQVIIFGYCVVVDAYCTWEYYRGMQDAVGTLRRRIQLITLSAGLFTIALLGNVIKPLTPAIAQNISSVGLALTAISAVLYYIAFIPPRWVRHAWQYEDLRDFLMPAAPAAKLHDTTNFQRLASAANQAVNGMLAAVYQLREDDRQWRVLGATDMELASTLQATAPDVLHQVWESRQPNSIYIPEIRDKEERQQLQEMGARTWLVAPILSAERNWGVLLVALRDRSLFTDDDLVLLELFAQQSAIVEENNLLITELQRYSEELEHKVAERTKELSESENALRELNATLELRVEQRTAELQRSNEELDNFAYVASHDLKAPLRAINHLANWIEQDSGDALPDAAKQHLSKLLARVERMETLLNDLLAYSRVGRKRHPIEQFALKDLVQDVSELVSPPADFRIVTCADLTMEVERIPLETVFRNLLGNAIKHHHDPSNGVVKINAVPHGNHVEFSVKDNGPGIAPEFHQRIFDIFTTLLPRDQVEASGIGLAIVKKSVESRGGNVWIDSAEGQGATVHFTWPLKETH